MEVRQILRQQAGVDIGNTIIADGSGLSRQQSDCACHHDVLQYIAQHDNEPITSLCCRLRVMMVHYSTGGLHEAGVDGKVSAKQVRCKACTTWLALSLPQAGSEWLVQYLSGYAVEPADQRNRRIPLVRFESRLYKDIYQNNYQKAG